MADTVMEVDRTSRKSDRIRNVMETGKACSATNSNYVKSCNFSIDMASPNRYAATHDNSVSVLIAVLIAVSIALLTDYEI